MKRTLEKRTIALIGTLRRRIKVVKVYEAKFGDGGETRILLTCQALLQDWLSHEREFTGKAE